MAYTTKEIRNIVLVGHASSGKTMLTEALLHAAGKIPSKGSIDKGSTVSDFDGREQKLQHSLRSSFCHFDHGGVHVNVIDTPGFPDFQGRALSVLPAAETVGIVVNGESGVEMMTQQMMEAAEERNLCRMIIVNKIDSAGVDAAEVVEQLRNAFGSQCLPINLPAEGGSKVVDCFFAPEGTDTDFSTVEEAHEQIVDQVVEVDEDLMEVYLEQGELSPEQLHEPFEKALRDGHLIPICFTSANTDAGIAELLDVFERLMPNPTEGNPPVFVRGEGEDAEEFTVTTDPGQHAIAHVVKIDVDPFRGRMAVFRMHQGTLEKGGQIFVGSARKPVKVSQMLKLNGGEQTESETAIPGDICAIPRAEDVSYDAVLHDSQDDGSIHRKSFHLPEPMYGRVVSADSVAATQKANEALNILCSEDPSLRVDHVAAMNETVFRGVGEMHLRVSLEEIAENYGVEIETAMPSIAYRETITGKAEGHHRHKKQSGGSGQFGEVYLRIEPLERGAGFEFANEVVGGSIPTQYIPAVEKGIREVLDHGPVCGHELQDVRATVYDGKHHPVDSKEIAFIAAGKKAFIEAVQKAKPIVMEPIVDVRITVPEDCMGDVAGDLSGMRGSVKGTNVMSGGRTEVSGQAPLKEIQSYHSRLKSLSGGKGDFTMRFSHYAQIPATDQQALAKEFAKSKE